MEVFSTPIGFGMVHQIYFLPISTGANGESRYLMIDSCFKDHMEKMNKFLKDKNITPSQIDYCLLVINYSIFSLFCQGIFF